MSRAGAWGGSLELHALAHMTKMHHAVYDDSMKGVMGRWQWYPHAQAYTDRPVVLLVNTEFCHFTLCERAVPTDGYVLLKRPCVHFFECVLSAVM